MHHENHYQTFLANNPYPRELKNKINLLNFSSNDYLGLAYHPELIKRAQALTQQYGAGSTSSRLVAGNLEIYEKLENQLAKNIGKPAALIMGTGFQTNTSVLSALLDPVILGQEALVFCDRYSHVSLLQGARFTAKMMRFQHNDLTHLEKLLEKYALDERPKFILAESIYSMDGDEADLPGLIALAKKHHAFLYIDDAHAVGVYGWGKAAEFAADIDIVMGTFSKGLGSFGGYVACSSTIKDYLVNKCKGLIYSTGLPPAVLGAIDAALDILPTLNTERANVLKHAERFRIFLKEKGLNYGASTTHIVPWIIGDAEQTQKTTTLLEAHGILAATIRPPSVPAGQSRIRFCFSATHTEADLEHLIKIIQKVAQKL